MNVTLIKPFGYCNGVKRAFNIVDKAIYDNPGKQIHIIGALIHNKVANDNLKKKNVILFDSDNESEQIKYINSLSNDSVIVFPAHGHFKNVEILTKKKGIKFYDSVCPVLLTNLKIINNNQDCFFFYVGDKNHMECKACTSFIKDDCFQIINKEDLNVEVVEGIKSKTILLAQSTCLDENIQIIKDRILNKYPNTSIHLCLCNVVKERENNLINSLKTKMFTKTIIVGDKNSANTTNLLKMYYLYTKNKNNCYFILDYNEIKNIIFDKNDNVLLTSGTSAPTEMVLKILEKIKKL